MAGIDNRYHAYFTYVRYWAGLLGTQVVSNWVFFISIRRRATLRRRAGYMLGFATHF